MSILIKKTPGTIVLAGNQNVLKVVDTNKYNAGIYSTGVSDLTFGVGHSDGAIMKITNSYGTVTFTCKNSPNDSGLQYPSFPVGGENNLWVADVILYLKKNVFLNKYYVLSINDANAWYAIVFTGRIVDYNLRPVLNGQPQYTYFNEIGWPSAQLFFLGYKILMNHERKVPRSYNPNSFTYENDGPFDCASRLPNRNELLEDSATYFCSVIAEKDISFLMQRYKTGHYTFPEPQLSWFVEHNILQYHKFFFYSQQGIPPIDGGGAESGIIYSLPGQMSELRQAQIHDQYGTFADWLNSTKSWLSFSPENKTIDMYSIEKLYYLCRVNQSLSFTITRFFTDGTNDSISVGVTLEENKIYEFCVSAVKVLGNSSKILKYYEVSLLDEGEHTRYQIKRFNIDYSYHPFARYFLFRNSLGVYESMRTTGSMTKNVEITKETSKKELPVDFTVGDVSEKVDRVNGTTSYTLNSGYLTQQEAEYFQEFLGSDDILWFKMGETYPVVVKESKVSLYKDNVFINNIPFTLIHSQSDNFENNFQNKPMPVGGDFNNDWNEDFNQ